MQLVRLHHEMAARMIAVLEHSQGLSLADALQLIDSAVLAASPLGSLASSGRSAGCWVAPRSQEEGSGHSERGEGRWCRRQPVPRSPICQLPTQGLGSELLRLSPFLNMYVDYCFQFTDGVKACGGGLVGSQGA